MEKPPVQRRILRNKLYLYVTEFFAGMAVMAVELGASRLLAPYFSSSQIVWTIIIATIMIAMALGNVYGGRSADRDPDPAKLYRRLLIASVWIAMIPVLGKYLILGITGLLVVTVSMNLLIIAAFLACMVIFVFPCFLLGTCTPSLIRFTVSGADDSGRTAGTLGACNTAGSIIGTFLPTFVTIPAVGTAVTFLIFSGVLLVIALLYFLSPYEEGTGNSGADHGPRGKGTGNGGGADRSASSGGRQQGTGGAESAKDSRRFSAGCATAVLLFLLATIFGNNDSFAFWEKDLTYEGESVYNYLQVRDTPASTILSTNVLFGVQSVTMKDNSLTGMYYDYAMAAPLMAERAEKMLILGMGTGTYARQCLRYFPSMKIRGVEIDEKITMLADKYFDAPAEAEVINYDGRAYLDADPETYDVIMVDAYQDITIPFQMSSSEFFSSVRAHLSEGGVMVVNMNMRSSAEDGINTFLSDTIAGVFPYVTYADVSGSTNRVLFASVSPGWEENFAAHLEKTEAANLVNLLENVRTKLQTYEGGDHILTDDKAPVELLGMRAIDEIIAAELGYYKEVFRRDGIRGLLGA